ncbi:MAG: hypothetical protein ACYCV7_02995 [Acidimicrobiales bacterium]
MKRPLLGQTRDRGVAAAAVLWVQGHNRTDAPVLRRIPSGRRTEEAALRLLVLLEAITVERHTKAPSVGRVTEVRFANGRQVDNDTVLAVSDRGELDAG